MYQIINPVDAKMPFGNPANLVNVTDTTWRIFNIRFQIAFSIVVLSIAFMLLIHLGIKKSFVSPGT
ncbi:Uncharacterised protein [Klebsiella pneumoniae]|nr:Uncharacterised protein [Klebsiella pneumoniae]